MSQISDLINGIGAINESNMIFFKAAIRAGFNDQQALELTKTYMTNCLASIFMKKDSEDNYE